jgi:hypothetical protein
MRAFKLKSILTILLWMLTIVCFFLIFKTSSDPVLSIFVNTPVQNIFCQFLTGNIIIFDLSTGFLISMIFYLLVVWFPDRQKKIIIKHNFEEQYRFFKEDTINILLNVCVAGRYDAKSPTNLLDQDEFRKYFKENISESQNRWDTVFNGLDGYWIKEILVELEILLNEVTFVLSNVYIDDPNVFSFLKRLSQSVYKLKNSSLEYDDRKKLTAFLWQLLAGWSVIDGYREEDIVKVMIEKI